MQITDYIKPELLAVALVLYFVGHWAETFSDHTKPVCSRSSRDSRYIACRSVCVCNDRISDKTGDRNGSFYGGRAGNPCGGTEHVCRSAAGAETQVL